ncbi:putative N-acetyltransferase YjaB [Streptomyces sp. ADI95-16]|uniref:GNAT family N-acetyltransferase n=1 Tax=Streptomyces sp. ADI95-16 TaxID=1522758 RepID=UPI000F3A99AD|nr:GNAT family N-acetyltransferase [Streptomyces sp. ADI95-16]AYV25136.1 putative N-acetyltransferase YjaB [Streptomyces sp. ADI95-16]
MSSNDVVLRRASDSDARAAADVWLRSFATALPTVRCAHDEAEVHDWFARVLVPRYETWVADTGSTVVGLLVLDGKELKQLYLDPAWRGRGLGDRFMSLAEQRKPDGLTLWTFQVNAAARRFYERHGFVEVERSDGLRNDEREPDVRCVWQPQT